MGEYIPEPGSMSAALLAEVANGQARDLRNAHVKLDELRAKLDRIKAHARPVLRSIEIGERVDPEDFDLLAEDVR
jgi:hypothetical protein